MDKWVAAQSTGPADPPETICIEILGGSFDGNPKQEHFHATVIARVEDPTSEEQRLEKGIIRLIDILNEKLRELQPND
jgi:hypothetical protein